MSNPFKENTTSYNDWEVLKDLEWHCTKCELKSGQAKTWQVWRQSGIQLAKDEKDNFYKVQFCTNCDMNTVHRKLESLEILDDTKVRTGIPVSLARKIKIIYKNEEALFFTAAICSFYTNFYSTGRPAFFAILYLSSISQPCLNGFYGWRLKN